MVLLTIPTEIKALKNPKNDPKMNRANGLPVADE
jgi:hypothetical protein